MRKVLVLAVVAVALFGWTVTSTHAHQGVSCAGCHVPHNAGTPGAGQPAGPLWNPALVNKVLPTYTLYSSPSFDALNTGITQPDGSSKLCLGCHDGSYPGIEGMTQFGTADLATSHPVSFTFDTNLAVRANGGLKDPGSAMSGLGGTISADLLDANSKMQCTSCHDVHQTAFSNALRWQYDTGAAGNNFCRTCHNK